MLFNRLAGKATPRTPTNNNGRRYGSSRTITGRDVDPDSALTVPAVLACITILAEDLSSMPLITYRRLARGKERATDHPLYSILHDSPNDEMTAMIFRELIVGHVIGWGNFYGQKIVSYGGQLLELWPLHPGRMRVDRDPKTNRKRFTYSPPAGGKQEVFDQEEIWHIPGFGYDGMVGYSKINLMRNSIALALSTEEFGGRFFDNFSQPSFVVKHPKTLSDTAYERLSASFDEEHRSPEDWHKHHILEDGLELEKIGIPPEDAQFLQTRQFQVREFARALRIPPHMVGDVEGSTSWGTGIEQQEQGYITHTLGPWAVRIEQGASKDLLMPYERKDYFVEHLFDKMMRGDSTARYNTYSVGLLNGIVSPNEVREKENMQPYEGGDTYRVPLNTTPNNSATTNRTFSPVANDAAARCLRRETHDLLDAAVKFAKRQDLPGAQGWLDNFYSQDYPTFMALQLAPVAQSMVNASCAAYTNEQITGTIRQFCAGVCAARAQGIKTYLDSLQSMPKDSQFWDWARQMIDFMGSNIDQALQSGRLAQEFTEHMMESL